MKTTAAVARELGGKYELMDCELDGPNYGEVLVKWKVAGLCHSDLHITSGDLPGRLPIVGGHEGAGVVEAVGDGVTHVAPGDHVVGSFIPACGKCSSCARGMSNLCDGGLNGTIGEMADGRYPFTMPSGETAGAMCTLGTFSQYTVANMNSVVKIQDWIPFEVAALVGCGVTTGWGSSVYSAEVEAGDTVVVFGIGGIGINAIQGAKHAGARFILAIDTDESKKEKALEFGATHFYSDVEEAKAELPGMTWGGMAEKAIITIGVADAKVTADAVDMVGKRGVVVLTSMAGLENQSIQLTGLFVSQYEKVVKGSLFGSANAFHDIPNILRLWDEKQLKLDELITHRFTLDQVNEAYELMARGGDGMVRGIVVHED